MNTEEKSTDSKRKERLARLQELHLRRVSTFKKKNHFILIRIKF
jgi:hypothetical protein